MEKVKIFVWDDLCLGLGEAHLYFQHQVYCFPMATGPGFGLFLGKKRQTWLVADAAWDGAEGDLWEVSKPCYERVGIRMRERGLGEAKILLPGAPTVFTWATSLGLLNETQKGARLKRISGLRGHLKYR